MMIPTAMSITFPLLINFLNSSKNFFNMRALLFVRLYLARAADTRDHVTAVAQHGYYSTLGSTVKGFLIKFCDRFVHEK